ncbi:MAG: radical SAM protein [Deltaproteobacteria bacterium]|nr:radical SAM protein [Deltaproteobacteria bacterium]
MLKVKYKFYEGHRDAFSSSPPWRLRSLFVNLTERCNLHCRYCHAAGDSETHMPRAMLEKIFAEAVEMGGPAIIFTGGEPLCYPYLEEALASCRRHGLECKIATNGTLLDDAVLALFLEHGVKSLQISLDTLAPRQFEEIKGVDASLHGRVLEAVRRCAATGRIHTVVSCVVQESTGSEVEDLVRFCHESEVATLTLYRMIPYGRAAGSGIAPPGEEIFQSVLEKAFQVFVALPRRWLVEIGLPWAQGSPLAERWKRQMQVSAVGCIAGKTSMTILTGGGAVPCVCMTGNGYLLGDVAREHLETLWNAPPMGYFRGEVPIEGCENCAAFPFCMGGCRSLAYLSSSSPEGRDPACRYWTSGDSSDGYARS